MKLTKLFDDFFNSERSGGLVLLGCTVLSLILTNSNFQDQYLGLWAYEVNGHSVTHWINDGLMAIFFLLIGLELEREVYIGELSNLRTSLLPVFAALGGMIIPAGFHLAFNSGTASQAGAGIPMATDIAFALGVLSLLGKRVPVSLKIFLTALAVIDDLGAILVIAIFYTGTIEWSNLAIASGIFVGLLIMNRLRVFNLIPYLIAGTIMWYFMLHSGLHATITGVLVAFAIPFGDGSEKTISYRLQHFLHKPVAFVILPLFALANTSIIIHPEWYLILAEANVIGIATGLIIGKPLGIVSFTYLALKLRIASISDEIRLKDVVGIGFLGGIGFTMSIFITLLAFDQDDLVSGSKIGIMLSSLVAGLIGFFILKFSLASKADGLNVK